MAGVPPPTELLPRTLVHLRPSQLRVTIVWLCFPQGDATTKADAPIPLVSVSFVLGRAAKHQHLVFVLGRAADHVLSLTMCSTGRSVCPPSACSGCQAPSPSSRCTSSTPTRRWKSDPRLAGSKRVCAFAVSARATKLTESGYGRCVTSPPVPQAHEGLRPQGQCGGDVIVPRWGRHRDLSIAVLLPRPLHL
jgi:hypothetical protein